MSQEERSEALIEVLNELEQSSIPFVLARICVDLLRAVNDVESDSQLHRKLL
jgi:hypothetical protein